MRGQQPRDLPGQRVARELVVPGSGPVVAPSAAATALSEQIRAPLWPPVPTAPSIAQPLRRSPDQSTLVPAPVAISNGVAVITATASTLRARPYFRLAVLWDLVLRPARSRRRLALWVVMAVVAAATIAILYRAAHSASGGNALCWPQGVLCFSPLQRAIAARRDGLVPQQRR
jgi:hypothetical protein